MLLLKCVMELGKEQIDLPRQWMGKLAYVIRNVLDKEECNELIKTAEYIGFEPASYTEENQKSQSEEFWNCSHCVLEYDFELTWDKIKKLVPETWNNRPVKGLNNRCRVFRYDPGENFHPHLDGSNVNENGDRSYLSVHIFLNEDFEGGQTIFLSMSEEEKTVIVPRTGCVLIFEHDILHEGAHVKTGRKYLLRTDVMYSCETVHKKSKLSRFLAYFHN